MNQISENVRFDTWLWAVRIFKTRSLATDKCKRGRVKVDGQNIKPSRKVQVGLSVSVKKEGVWREFEVLALLDKRVGAKLAVDYVKETTLEEVLEHYAVIRRLPVPQRYPGAGRPTKKERRDLERFFTPTD